MISSLALPSLRVLWIEERLWDEDVCNFFRSDAIANLVNLEQITALDLSLTGTIRMTLAEDTVCYVSRRYVKKIKEALGL